MRIFGSVAALLATVFALGGCAATPREETTSSAALPGAAVSQTDSGRLSNKVFMDE